MRLFGRAFQIVRRVKMDDIPNVDIDTGKFKYILIKVFEDDEDKKKEKFIVRGYKWAGYHGKCCCVFLFVYLLTILYWCIVFGLLLYPLADILDRVEPGILKNKLKCDCVGGGRIEHSPAKKTIHIYGYSTGYGQADHKISVELVKKEYPEHTVTWSNEGY